MAHSIHTLDETDRKILSLIQSDSRMTMAQIAKAVGNISKVAVSYRLRKLEDRGVIEQYYAKLNPEKLDRGYLVISRAVCSIKGKKEVAVSRRIAGLPGVQSVYGIFGDYDLLFVARTTNKEEAKKLLDRVNEIPGVTSSNTIVAHTVVKESLLVDLSKVTKKELQGF
jgi:Lrp/AsnC family leucine-responsive transcriptional regulator